jgi:hypothetical protein
VTWKASVNVSVTHFVQSAITGRYWWCSVEVRKSEVILAEVLWPAALFAGADH